MGSLSTIDSDRFYMMNSILQEEEIKHLPHEANDLLEPQFYPDPVIFRASLDKINIDEEELKKNMSSNKATFRVLAPYLKIIQKEKKRIISQRSTRPPKADSGKLVFDKKLMEQFAGVVSDVSERFEMILSIHETANILKFLVKAGNVVTYLVNHARNELYQSPRHIISSTSKLSSKIELGTTIAAHAAFTKTHITSNNISSDSRFPFGVGFSDSLVKYALCVPINTPDGKVVAVYELTRDNCDIEFDNRDVQLILTVTSWIGVAILQNTLYTALARQHELTNSLLQLTCLYHSGQTDVDKTLSDIVIFARETIGAERCILYVVEKASKYSMILEEYDQGTDNNRALFKRRSKKQIENDNSPLSRTLFHKEIANKYEIVKEVNLDGENATRSLLRVPILSSDEVIGAIQLVNAKEATQFDKEDIKTLQRFATFCTININHLKVHDRVNKSELEKNVNHEMLFYHIKPCSHDEEAIANISLKDFPDNFFTFRWYPSGDNLPKLVELTISLFQEVLGDSFMALNNVPKFVLTVQNCYRQIPYHNFLHAFTVLHTMANIIFRYNHIFTGLERSGLMVAALCHDLDHRGFTNNFIQLSNHYLADLYESSPTENHHFAVTKVILHQCRMFKYFKPEMYNKLLVEIYECILATDLSLYFQCRMELMKVADEKSFTFKNPKHRRLVKNLIMAACELSGQTKPLPISTKLTEDAYEEYFQEGDLEKRMGLSPLPAMNRDKGDMIAENQVQFLSVVVIPCVDLVSRIFSALSPMVSDARFLLKQWKDLIEVKNQDTWKPEESVV